MFGIGVPELILILIVGLLVFGPGKLPEVARSLGKGLREFKKATNALSQAINAPEQASVVQPQQTAAQQPAEKQAAAAAAQPAAPVNTVAAQPYPAGQQTPAAPTGVPEKAAVDVPSESAGTLPQEAAPSYQAPTQESVRQQIAAQQAEKKTE